MEIKTPPTLITKPSQLEALATTLAQQPVVAVDTESNSLYAYRERVCLIQFSIPDADYLVDPLALADLSILEPIFSNPQIEKVFHAAEYDLLCLKRDFGFTFTNLFDTMLAARILGREKIGLGDLLEAEFNVHLKKKYQRADWGKRPLPPEMISYARLDTHYLIPLRDRLHSNLKRTQFWPIAQEDFTRICEVNGTLPGPPETDIWRMRGANELSPQQMAVLEKLVDYRKGRSETLNRPLFKVISDKTLVNIAAGLPEKPEDLRPIPGMTHRQIGHHGRSILKAVQSGLKSEPPRRPSRPRPDDSFLQRMDNLRNWRKRTAQKLGVESDVVMPRVLLDKMAYKNPQSWDELNDILESVPWRLEHFGKDLLKVLAQENRH
jgi:ribonuclease D